MAKNQHNAGLHYRPLNQLGLSNFNDHIENPIDSRFKFNPPPLKCGKLFGLRKVDRQKEELQKHCPWHPLLKMKAFTLEIDGEAEYINLLDTLTISENIALALSINKTPARDVEPRIQDIAQKLNITDILNKYPYQVSGGQKQRCACARAIINNPKLLLADEPTGALDSHSAQMLLSTIQSINEQLSATILMVTHDAFTASYASRILFLQDGAIFTELRKGNDSRSAFFEKILNVLTMIGGGQSHVC